MSKLDIALLIVTGLVAISGFVEGFVLGACATARLILGSLVGVYGVPLVLDNSDPSVSVSFVALVGVIVLAASGRTLGAFVPERIHDVRPPDTATGRLPAVRATYTRVAKITGVAACSRGLEGSGFVYAPRRVMTNAHVVAGVDKPKVELDGEQYDATVVHYDPQVDIAVLYVPGLNATPLAFDRSGKAEASGVVLGFLENGPFDAEPVRIRSEERLRGPNIYGTRTVTRQAFSIWASVRPGNSGGPLISSRGTVYGVVFAASVEDDPAGAHATERVDTGPCT